MLLFKQIIKILVAGNSNKDFAIARYNSDGSLDTSFSADGKVTTDFGGSIDFGDSITIQLDGKILVTANKQWWFCNSKIQ